MPTSSDWDIARNLGIHRVIEPVGLLPQAAWKLDNTPVAQFSETLVEVQALHIDSASFTQIANICEHDSERMKKHIMDIVAQRGKMHNPTTGSGGVLIGTIYELDETYGKTHRLTIGDIIAVEYSKQALHDVASLNVADVLVQGNATQALELVKKVQGACPGREYLADLAINVVNVPDTEFATILLTKPSGCILFFSMATSFTAAALGAEGIASQVEMHIENGYMPDNRAVSLQLLRDYPVLRTFFTRRFS